MKSMSRKPGMRRKAIKDAQSAEALPKVSEVEVEPEPVAPPLPGPTPEEAREQLREANRLQAEKFAALPPDVRDALIDFGEAWMRVPPLVRASKAVNTLNTEARDRERCQAESEVHGRNGLHRRAIVSAHFGNAANAISVLMQKLCREGDDEAARRGIDADIVPSHNLSGAAFAWRRAL